MIHIVTENNVLKHRTFMLPDGIKKHLTSILKSYKGDKTVNGYKRLNNLLSSNSLSYYEMKRIKNFFDNYNGTDKSAEYILNGGEPMKLWVDNTLNTATASVKNYKQAMKDAGINNAFRKPHEKNRQTKKKNKLTLAKVNTNNLTKNIQNNTSVKFESKTHINKEYDMVFEDYYSEYGISYVIEQFIESGGKGGINWYPLIKPQMYKKALDEYMKFGKLMHFPAKYVFQWMGIIMKNTAILEACTEIAGHTQHDPSEEIEECLRDIIKKEYGDYTFNDGNIITNDGSIIDFDDYLDKIGLYDFLKLPDGSDAWSDYGLAPIFNLILNYDERSDSITAEETLILINKILDVYHCRGDLSSAFIEGGAKSLLYISEEMKHVRKRNMQINERKTKDISRLIPKRIYNYIEKANAEYIKLKEYTEDDQCLLDFNGYFYGLSEPIYINKDYELICNSYYGYGSQKETFEDVVPLILYDEEENEYYFNQYWKDDTSAGSILKDAKRGLKYFKEYDPNKEDEDENYEENFMSNLTSEAFTNKKIICINEHQQKEICDRLAK